MNDFFPLTHYFWLLDPVKGNEHTLRPKIEKEYRKGT